MPSYSFVMSVAASVYFLNVNPRCGKACVENKHGFNYMQFVVLPCTVVSDQASGASLLSGNAFAHSQGHILTSTLRVPFHTHLTSVRSCCSSKNVIGSLKEKQIFNWNLKIIFHLSKRTTHTRTHRRAHTNTYARRRVERSSFPLARSHFLSLSHTHTVTPSSAFPSKPHPEYPSSGEKIYTVVVLQVNHKSSALKLLLSQTSDFWLQQKGRSGKNGKVEYRHLGMKSYY